jgi:hypothetical protein
MTASLQSSRDEPVVRRRILLSDTTYAIPKSCECQAGHVAHCISRDQDTVANAEGCHEGAPARASDPVLLLGYKTDSGVCIHTSSLLTRTTAIQVKGGMHAVPRLFWTLAKLLE